MLISLIATVLNEGESIRRLMDSIVAQTRQPNEIVIVDGGSDDNTVTLLHEYAERLSLRVLVEAGANISVGRNRAIAAATGDIIAVTDAGVTLEHDWLERLTAPFQNDPSLDVVAGFFQADPRTVFEVALGATTLPLVEEIKLDTFLPSSRSIAFRKSAWEKVGGYPEWLDYCEDLVFDLALKGNGAQQAFVPNALVHFRPRKSFSSFYRQYYLYARGDGKADLWRKRHAARYGTYLIGLPLLLTGLLFGRSAVRMISLALFSVGAVVYLRQPYRRLPVVLEHARRNGISISTADGLQAATFIPIIRLVGDIAKMIGYPVGWVWRLRQRGG